MNDPTQPFTNREILTLIVSTGVVSAGLTAALNWLREWWFASGKQKGAATYLAMRIAVALEAFTIRCSDQFDDNGNAPYPADQMWPDIKTSLPDLPDYPDDADAWRGLDAKLAERALSFRTRMAEAASSMRATIEYRDESVVDEAQRMLAEFGVRAADLARDLRRRYALADDRPLFEHNKYLAGQLDKIRVREREERRQLEAERNALRPAVAALVRERDEEFRQSVSQGVSPPTT